MGSVDTINKNCYRNTRISQRQNIHNGHALSSQESLHCVPDDRIVDLSWTGSGVLQGSTGLPYNAFPFPICLTKDFPSSYAVNILPWPVYSPSCSPSSIGEGPHWLPVSRDPPPETIAQLCLVIRDIWDEIPQAKISHLSIHATEMHEAHGLSKPLLTLLHLTVSCTEQNATVNFCLTNDDSWQFADLTLTKQFLLSVSQLLNWPLKLLCVSFFCWVYVGILTICTCYEENILFWIGFKYISV